MKNIFKSIDTAICRYIGLEKQEIIPIKIKTYIDKITVINNESFKRHLFKSDVDKFCFENVRNMKENYKKIFGIAVGKSIAKNLIISFGEIQIKGESINAK